MWACDVTVFAVTNAAQPAWQGFLSIHVEEGVRNADRATWTRAPYGSNQVDFEGIPGRPPPATENPLNPTPNGMDQVSSSWLWWPRPGKDDFDVVVDARATDYPGATWLGNAVFAFVYCRGVYIGQAPT
jgi:hypothetical protein